MMKYNDDIIEFFKKHNLYEKEMFEYLEDKTDMVDYQMEEDRSYIGCAYSIDRKTNKLVNFRICIPFCYDDKTTLIGIHEIAHGIWAYKHLNKRVNDIEIELFPMLLEKIYLMENPSTILKNYTAYLDSTIDEEVDEKYRFALSNRDTLLNDKIDGFNSINKRTRRLVRKWCKAKR